MFSNRKLNIGLDRESRNTSPVHESQIVHSSNDLPLVLIDVIGYANDRVLYTKTFPKKVFVGDYTKFKWRPASISRILKNQLLPAESKRNTTTVRHKDEEYATMDSVESSFEHLEQMWDYYAIMGEYSQMRNGKTKYLQVYI
jgi:hypothetical protein